MQDVDIDHIKSRLRLLIDRIESLIEEERSALPEGVEIIVLSKEQCEKVDFYTGSNIGFGLIINKTTLAITRGRNKDSPDLEIDEAIRINNFFNKKISLIPKFENGGKRYLNSALFRSVLDSLSAGSDPIEIIDNLCRINESLQEQIVNRL